MPVLQETLNKIQSTAAATAGKLAQVCVKRFSDLQHFVREDSRNSERRNSASAEKCEKIRFLHFLYNVNVKCEMRGLDLP